MVPFPGYAGRSVWSAATVCHCHCGGRGCTSRVPQGQDKPSLCLEAQSSHLGPDRWETPHNQQTQVCDNYGLPTQISRRALLPNICQLKNITDGPRWTQAQCEAWIECQGSWRLCQVRAWCGIRPYEQRKFYHLAKPHLKSASSRPVHSLDNKKNLLRL